MKALLTPIPVLLAGFMCVAQNVSYLQSNKEIEYHYGVMSDEALSQISDLEKIKYEFRYMERSITKKIDANFDSYVDIFIDSNGYEQSWMDLAKRFKYSPTGIELFDKQNQFMRTINYSSEQALSVNKTKEAIRENGYHPGLPSFPKFTQDEITMLNAEGMNISKNADGMITIVYPNNEKEVYDPNLFTITREWYDENAIRTVQTDGYEPYLTNRGYLLRISKTEKFLQSVNGPCITEVQLKYFTDYHISDYARLIDRATNNIDSVFIFPNPNNGVFTVEIKTSNESRIMDAKIVNLMTGDESKVDIGSDKFIAVNRPDLLPGNYVFRVTTTQTVISAQFVKQ